MELKEINFFEAQQRAKELGLQLKFTSNLFENFDLDAMDDKQRWIWTGEGHHPLNAKPVVKEDRASLLSELLELKGFLDNFDQQLRAA